MGSFGACDVPELTDGHFADSELHWDDPFVERCRGRTKAVAAREQIDARFDRDRLQKVGRVAVPCQRDAATGAGTRTGAGDAIAAAGLPV